MTSKLINKIKDIATDAIGRAAQEEPSQNPQDLRRNTRTAKYIIATTVLVAAAYIIGSNFGTSAGIRRGREEIINHLAERRNEARAKTKEDGDNYEGKLAGSIDMVFGDLDYDGKFADLSEKCKKKALPERYDAEGRRR